MLALVLEGLAAPDFFLAQARFLAIAPFPLRAGEKGHAQEKAEQEGQQHDDPLVRREIFHRSTLPRVECAAGLTQVAKGWFRSRTDPAPDQDRRASLIEQAAG